MRQIGKLRPSSNYVQKRFGSKNLLVAEIGVQRGDNAISLLKLNLEQLYLIDIWKPYKIAGKYGENDSDANFVVYLPTVVKRFGNCPKVSILKTSSLEASKFFRDSYLDFAYIDACHSYEAVKQDLTAWYPKVKNGGVLAGHDYDSKIYPGLARAVDEFIERPGFKLYQEELDWWIVKDLWEDQR